MSVLNFLKSIGQMHSGPALAQLKQNQIHLFGKSQVFQPFKITVSVNASVMENRKWERAKAIMSALLSTEVTPMLENSSLQGMKMFTSVRHRRNL